MRDMPSDLAGKLYDVAIIGGGINGASAAQHLAAAGYSVLLVDKDDFGSGSSSRSSRLLHCGLRYLAPGRSAFDFVAHPGRFVNALKMARQAMHARSEFIRTSSVRARPMRFCFPIFTDGPYATWQVNLAFRMLRALGPKDLPLDYRLISSREAATMPLVGGLRDFTHLISGAVFREYQLDWPERICMDAALDAERLGADIRNYTAARIVRRQGENWVLELIPVDRPTEPTFVNARTVLNTSGIWIDDVTRKTTSAAKRRVFGTKGCHIVVKLPDDCSDIGIATLNSKQEPFYCIPWRGYHYFGPTETPFEGDADDVHVTREERAWLIGEANRMLPGLQLSDADVLMTWAGVRPLTYDENEPNGSRSRVIHDLAADGLPNVFAMTGGPVMSHRSAGRELADLVAGRLSASGKPQTPSYEPRLLADNQNSPPLLDDHASIKLADLRYAARDEHAHNLMDILFRRVGIGWECALSDRELADAADAVGQELGWDAARKKAEINVYRERAKVLFDPREKLRPIDFSHRVDLHQRGLDHVEE
jgi:glycerol-3-phosphate dehydrogenase